MARKNHEQIFHKLLNNVPAPKKYSISKHLKKEGRSNDNFEVMLSNISLEELISLKLEISYRSVGIPLYIASLWTNITDIAQDAFIKFALTACGDYTQVYHLLGISQEKFFKYMSKEKLEHLQILGGEDGQKQRDWYVRSFNKKKK
jgi:hypothetical protein